MSSPTHAFASYLAATLYFDESIGFCEAHDCRGISIPRVWDEVFLVLDLSAWAPRGIRHTQACRSKSNDCKKLGDALVYYSFAILLNGMSYPC